MVHFLLQAYDEATHDDLDRKYTRTLVMTSPHPTTQIHMLQPDVEEDEW